MINVAIIDDNYREVEPIIDIISPAKEDYSYQYFDGANQDNIYNWFKSQMNPVVMLDLLFNGEELGEVIFAGIKKFDRRIPIFIFSSVTDLRTEQKYKDLGCYDYIVKNRVRREDAQILLERIKRACEAGSRFNEAFERCRKLWLSDQRSAILSLNDLLKSEGQQNLMALYELHDWLKIFLKKDLEELSIGLPIALSMLERSCSAIEAIQKDMPVDIILDKVLSQIHLGKQGEARESLKRLVDLNVNASQGKRFIGSLSALSSDELNVESMLSIIDMTPASDGYESIMEWMYHYNKALWNEAVTAYFTFWKRTGGADSARIIALFNDDSYPQIKGADLFKYHAAEVTKFIFDMFTAELKRVQEQETADLSSLYNCSRLLFDGISPDSSLPSGRDESCENLNAFAVLLYLRKEPQQRIDFVDDKIAKIGTTREKVINDVVARPGRDAVQRRNLLYQIMRTLLNSNMRAMAIKILKEQEQVICDSPLENVFGYARVDSLGGVQLYRFGELLSEACENEVTSRYMRHSVESLLRDSARPELQKQRNDILFYVQLALKKLKEMGVDIVSYEDEYKRLSSENIRTPLPFDGKRCAIAGGRDFIKERIGDFEKSLGGEFTHYGIDVSNMVKSIRSGGIDIVVYVRGHASHTKTWEPLQPVKDQVVLYMMKQEQTQVDAIIEEVKRQLKVGTQKNES